MKGTFSPTMVVHTWKLIKIPTFVDCLVPPMRCGCGCQFFAEKTFADRPKTSKLVKVLSLENFPLYVNIGFCFWKFITDRQSL